MGKNKSVNSELSVRAIWKERNIILRIPYEELAQRQKIFIWGTGQVMAECINKIDPDLKICGLCDTYEKNWGKYFAGNLCCSSKENLSKDDTVLIAMKAEEDIEQVSKEMDNRGIDYCHIYEAVDAYRENWDIQELERYEKLDIKEHPYNKNKIVKYIDCYVPYRSCNLKCGYCYIGQVNGFRKTNLKLHSAKFIRAALSAQRLGGTALINFCAGGETLMVKELVPIITELVKEGHYISVVTNGTITSTLDELLDSGVDISRLFIKFSFHYLELKRTGSMDVFFANIRKARKAGVSVTVELVPSDELVPYIDEIKNCSIKNLGTLPHLTVPRDDTVSDLKVLTNYPLDEYEKIWGQFASAMFDFKLKLINIKRLEYCKAGEWSFHMHLDTGNIFKCLQNPYLDNLYENICREIRLEPVGNRCCLPYCYNGHSYLPLGLVEEIEAPTYYCIRDRETIDGEHWVTDEMKKVFTQKLFLNNSKDN